MVGGRFLSRLDTSWSFGDWEGWIQYRKLKHDLVSYGHYRWQIKALYGRAFGHILDHVSQSISHSCPDCLTEYEVTIRPDPVSIYLFVLKRWSDLGDGIDQRSLEWQSSSTLDRVRKPDQQGMPSVRERFEAADRVTGIAASTPRSMKHHPLAKIKPTKWRWGGLKTE